MEIKKELNEINSNLDNLSKGGPGSSGTKGPGTRGGSGRSEEGLQDKSPASWEIGGKQIVKDNPYASDFTNRLHKDFINEESHPLKEKFEFVSDPDFETSDRVVYGADFGENRFANVVVEKTGDDKYKIEETVGWVNSKSSIMDKTVATSNWKSINSVDSFLKNRYGIKDNRARRLK